MRPDTSLSRYIESATAEQDFTRDELFHCRFLLRRLQFLEAKEREDKMVNGGAVFAKTEVAALEWTLGPDGLDFIRVIIE